VPAAGENNYTAEWVAVFKWKGADGSGYDFWHISENVTVLIETY
jgi:hypothetical protein